MKKHILSLLLTMLLCMTTTTIKAHDIAVNNDDGVTIYYDWTNGNTELAVSYQGASWNGVNEYSGEVVIPESVLIEGTTYNVTAIGDYAFGMCNGLTSVTIPNSVTSIGVYAFAMCGGLTSVTIPNSVTFIGNGAFQNCIGLTSITFGNGLTFIGQEVFMGCIGLTNITIPNTVTFIGDGAFSECSGLTSVTIPDTVTKIGNSAFSGCGLISLTIPSSVTSIGDWAFSVCNALTSVTIPSTVTFIGNGAFSGCSGLTSISVETENTAYDSRENCNAIIETSTNKLLSGCNTTIIPGSVTSIGDYAFYDCIGITSITIPNSVTSIGPGAFYACGGLTSITIPHSVTEIGDYAFCECNAITSVIIGSGVTEIGDYAFSCPVLTDVYCSAATVPSASIDAFEDSNIESATLHVPDVSLESYSSTAPWSSFGTKVALEKCASPTISYANGKLTFSSETEGAECVTTICDTDIKTHYGNEIFLTATYTITAYATKAGYDNSEVATAILCWINAKPQTEGIIDEDAVTEIQALPVLIQTQGDIIIVQGAKAGTEISLYSVNGMLLDTIIASKEFASMNASRLSDSVAIVKIGGKSVKVLIK